MITDGLTELLVRLHCRNTTSILADAVERELLAPNPLAKLKSAAVAADRDR